MEKENLYSYLQKTNAKPYYIELLQYSINRKIYHYGDNFISPFSIRKTLKSNLRDSYHLLFKIKNQKRINGKDPRIISNAYFSFNSELKKIGFEPFTPFWTISKTSPYLKDLPFLLKTSIVNRKLDTSPLNEIINENFFNLIDDYKDEVVKMVKRHDISAVIFSNDLGFHERLFIDVFKFLNKPSFIYSHGGSPIVYNGVDDNKSDYLIVWGDAIKEEYINSGIKSDKIIVAGHPKYTAPCIQHLKFGLDNILVLTKAAQGAPTDSTKVFLFDKGNAILYLLQIREVLLDIGVRSVRLRLHPSENPEWYNGFIDNEFFKIDYSDLTTSINSSTAVIGGTSTVFIETLYYGINYVVYEPSDESNTDIYGILLRSPFDGKNSKVPVNKNIVDLKNALVNRIACDPSLIPEYLKAPFDISFMKDLVK